MMMPEQDPTQVLDEIVRRLIEAIAPQEIYLFGSHATGRTHRRSDLDFLIVVPDDAGSASDLTGRAYNSVCDIGVPKDIIVIRRSNMDKWGSVKYSLPHEVLTTGKLLYAA